MLDNQTRERQGICERERKWDHKREIHTMRENLLGKDSTKWKAKKVQERRRLKRLRERGGERDYIKKSKTVSEEEGAV